MSELKIKFDTDPTGIRVSKLLTDKGLITGHERLANSTDFGYRLKVKHATRKPIEFPSSIFATMKGYDGIGIDSLKNPKVFDSHKIQIKNTIINKDKISTFFPNFRKNITITNERNNLMIELQKHSKIDWITVNDISPTSKPEDWTKRIETSREIIENDNTLDYTPKAIPSIDMGMRQKEFIKKLDVVINCGFPVVNMIYASLMQHRSNYFYLRKTALNENIWILMSNVPRVWGKDRNISTPHLLPLFGVDGVSISMPSQYKPQEGQTSVNDVNILTVKRFVQDTLGNIKLKEHLDRYDEDIKCNPVCSLCEGKTITQFYTEFNEREVLVALNNIHELYSSYYELKMSNKLIGDYKTYIKSKEHLLMGIGQLIKPNSMYNFIWR